MVGERGAKCFQCEVKTVLTPVHWIAQRFADLTCKRIGSVQLRELTANDLARNRFGRSDKKSAAVGFVPHVFDRSGI